MNLSSGKMGAKVVQFLRELMPAARSLGFLLNRSNPASTPTDAQAAALELNWDVLVLSASTDDDLEKAFSTFAQQRIDATYVITDPFFFIRRAWIVALATRYAIPAIYGFREFVIAGGLMSYGADLRETNRLAGSYVGRILKGEKPADLPVQQAVKVELVINLKTAKALGLTIPETLLATADEVIQ
jgi:putative ABC transport system substrate-binding protein